MNEEIEKIEKKKPWTLVSRPKDLKKNDWNKMGIQK